MKLSKKTEAEVLKTYHAYWNAYLEGNMRVFASMLDKDCHLIGSAAGEVFYNKKSAVTYYKATAEQIAGKAEFRNRNITVMPVDRGVLVNEELDFYLLIDNQWTFYGHGRISSLFHKRNNKWKVIHQHGSLPDSKTEEGEQVNTEKIKAENVHLRDAVKRRTIQLEEKNRELEIETALEKVRTVAMGMKEPADMLEVCSTISHQLQALDVREIRNVQTAIFYKTRGIYLNYEFFRLSGKKTITEVEYNLQDDVKTFVNQMLTDPEAFFTTVFKGAKLKKWIEYQKKANQFVDPHLYEVKSLHYYFYSIGPGALGVSTYAPLNENELAVFKRFRNVFELAYRRFMDIEQALAQAREAQIQLALERVRARTMAMQHSHELNEVVHELYLQIRSLNFQYGACTIVIMNKNSADMEHWLAGFEQEKYPERYPVQNIHHPLHDAQISAWKKGKKFATFEVSGDDVKVYADLMFTQTGYKNLPKDEKKRLRSQDFVVFNMAYMSFGALMWAPARLTDEQANVLQRFASVFDQTYTRFLDIQKAEAQAKEAQIQLALERVRARTMAMHNSDELAEVAALLFEQVKHLGVETYASGFNLWDREHKNLVSWMSNPTGSINPPFEMPIHEYEQHRRIYTSWKNNESFIEDDLTGEALTKHYKFLRSFPLLDEAFRRSEEAGIKTPDRQVHNNAYFSSGYLLFITSEPCQQYHDIFIRFAKVFEQTYTRFIDLQKAEAQAREAQIEAALERVRSQSMAMRTSEELKNVVKELRKQIGLLGQKELDTCVIQLYDESPDYVHSWASMTPSENNEEIRDFNRPTPKKGLLIIEEALQAYSSGRIDYILLNEKRKLKQWIDFVEKTWPDIYSVFINTYHGAKPEDAPTYWSFSDFNGGSLLMVTLAPPTDVSRALLRRFANVFGLAYRRFVDIKQAEAQARESQIQLALERVRARTMAMQKSDELRDAASLLFKQLEGLGVTSWSSGFNIWQDEGRSAIINMCNPDGSIAIPYHLPHTEDIFFIKICEARQRHEDLLVMETGGKELEDTYNYMFSLPEVKKMLGGMEDTGFQIPKFQVNHCAFFSQGYLMFITYEPVPEMWDVFKRFAKVFEQTYTRFLDLQKAEAQAREATIEAALEKVRSRSMGMQKSDELKEVIAVVFEKLKELRLVFDGVGIQLFTEGSRDTILWVAAPDHLSAPSLINLPYVKQDFEESEIIRDFWKAKQEGEGIYCKTYSFEEKNRYFNYVWEHNDFLNIPAHVREWQLQTPNYTVTVVMEKNSALLIDSWSGQTISTEEFQIPKRVLKVFEQTYTRFLDLQKAEAQAREAKIEAALEKVRSRTMAMQRSDELADVAQLLFQQVKDLGITAWTAGFNVWQPDNDAYIDWVTDPTGVQLEPYRVPLTGHPTFREVREARLRGDDFFVSYLEGEQIIETYQLLNRYADKGQFQKMMDSGIQFPTSQFNHFVFGAQVSLLFITYEPCRESHDIFKRFGKVFEQTYTRFLDLQKAEAQAREAKIETALEKVRSRSLAMHKSDEIEEVLHTLYERLKELNIDFYTAIIILFEKGSKDVVWWLESKANHPFLRSLIPYTDTSYFRNLFEARQNGTELISNFYPFEEKNKLFHHLFDHTDLKYTPEEQKKFLLEAEFATMAVALAKNTAIHLTSYSRTSFSEQDHDVLKRFAKVFEQAYTRFLDLQKAEAQAREAQIEVALERTRTQSMIMQHSKELDDTLRVFHEQVLLLGINSAFSFLWLPDEEKDRHIFWAAWGEDLPPEVSEGQAGKNHSTVFKSKAINYPLDRNEPATTQCLVDWKSNEPVYSYHVPPAAVENYFAVWQELIDGVEHLKPEYFSGGLHYVEAFMKYGCFGVMVATDLTDDEKKILARFAIEFERTYTRFLDLQRSEAQAREAQIQLAMERVRARTMAMQRSEELTDTAALLFQQINELGVPQLGNAFHLWDDDMKTVSVWACTKGVMSPVFKIPLTEDPVMINIANAALKGEPLYVEAMEGDSLQNHYTNMLSIPAFKELYEVLADSGNTPPKFQIFHAAYFSYGYILFVTNEPYAEAHDIFIRFAKVFEQTYTRFLDLQKAEEQARESQIQLALERVRARTMAMQKSDELPDAASLLFKQIADLGIKLWSTAFQIWNADDISTTAWPSAPDGSIQAPFRLPYNEDIFFKRIYEARQSGKDFFVMESSGKELEGTYHYMFNLPGVKKYFDDALDSGFQVPKFQITHCAFFAQGYVMFITYETIPEAWDIFKRFAKVFEQTYTRFLDLQKSEAQARESQIQLALERVRARTMAMQKSDELPETSFLLFQQVKELGETTVQNSIGIINEEAGFVELSTTVRGHHLPHTLNVPIDDPYVMAKAVAAWKAKHKSLKVKFEGQELKDYNAHRNSFFETKVNFPEDQWIVNIIFFSKGWLSFSSDKDISGETFELLKRFAAVFEQTYIRFNDLKQAEAQAREAQIEAALERVRSRSMGMQKSEELKEVIQVVYEQFAHLNIHIEHTGFIIDYKERDDMHIWLADRHEVPSEVTIPYFDCAHWNSFNEAKEKGTDFFANQLSFEEKNRFYRDLFKLIPGVPEETLEYYFNCPGLAISTVLLENVGLYIENFSGIPYTDEENNTLMRFGKVFQQTYTRFLDLQKAEAQARESQIEAALERVRSRTMAMQRSAELAEVATVLFQQVNALGVHQWTCGFGIFEIDDKEFTWYQGSEDGSVLPPCQIPLTEHPVFISFNESRKRGDELYVYEKTGEIQRDHYRYMCSLPVLGKLMQDRLNAGMQFPTFQIDHVASFSHGNLVFITYEPVPEMHDVFKRFAKVFDQTYTRFLDLQKSEAQAREAKIEAALERVRSRSMAMQRSEELAEVATVLFQQVKALGVPQWVCGFSIFEIDDKECTWYPGSADGDILTPMKIPLTEHPVFISYNESRKRGDELLVYEKGGEYQAGHYRYMQSLPGMGGPLQKMLDAGFTIPTFQIDHIANFSHGNLLFITYEHFPEMHDVFKRFAKVFDQTYTRFLDLQKSEAQAREAKIEAALERVRSRTMAMQHSNELGDAALLLFQQAQALGARSFACGFTIWGEKKKTATFWMAQESMIQPPFIVNSTEDVFRDVYKAAQRGESLYVKEQEGKELETHYQYMSTNTVFKGIMEKMKEAGLSVPVFQILHCAFFSQGFLLFITYEPIPEIWDVFKRFAKVFEQTYTRFLDLQKAEAQARDAVKQASVDRVRAEIASMRTTNDLERITPLIWNELTTLGVPFIRCGVFIMDEEEQLVQSFLSTPDGKAIAAFRQPYNSPGEIAQVVEHWHKKKRYQQHWNEAQFIANTKNLVQQGAITSGEKYLTEIRPTDLYLHFIPFLQGMLYAGSTTALSDDELRLMQDLADAFSTAYARYEDFNKLEAAKETVEQTLVDLKQAQQQLVQSEKMASLGELTAGIAHEIQNPLNFVNNFSEVNRELLSEMKAEIEKGNIGEVIAIANDIIGNEEKINHHGKRADAIVKGMLQHSRTGGGQKEPTDINALCDEYLRLAYHGLRAKDKSFNAKFETNLDKRIGKINIIPQDIGRVLVNLINNAFYAVNEKQKHASAGLPAGQAGSASNGYEPSVTITSKKDDDGIELSVTDNGNGIPRKVLDKIFQPFFTTKPTGQGTGLGLSLAYDIIKSHNGEIKVESKEREGTTFTIRLPENS